MVTNAILPNANPQTQENISPLPHHELSQIAMNSPTSLYAVKHSETEKRKERKKVLLVNYKLRNCPS
jgi:hypothetical protein